MGRQEFVPVHTASYLHLSVPRLGTVWNSTAWAPALAVGLRWVSALPHLQVVGLLHALNLHLP